MGNAQSVGQHGQHHNRLSKPKTNTNSPALVDSPTSVTSRFGYLSSRERQQIKAQLLSPVDTEFGGHRDSTDGDEGLGELASNVQRRLSNLSRTNSLSCFGGGRDSATKLANLPNSKLSLVSSSQVDLNTAIRILEEVKRNASPEDLVALGKWSRIENIFAHKLIETPQTKLFDLISHAHPLAHPPSQNRDSAVGLPWSTGHHLP